MNIKRNILLSPGPVTTSRAVKRALIVADICPREEEFIKVMKHVREQLVRVVNGRPAYTAVLFSGSGTAAVEACISSIIAPGKKVLIVNNGAYARRMIEIVAIYGIKVVELLFDSNAPVNLEKIEDALNRDRSIAAIAMVHHETSTGMLNPIKKVGLLAKKYKKTFLVDAISSFAGVPVDIKQCHVDFLVSTSNKCIQGFPGVSFVICRKHSLYKIKGYPRRAYYLSLYDQYANFDKTGESRFTPPVQVIYALKKAMEEYFLEGELNRRKRYVKNMHILKSNLEKLGFRFLLKEENLSAQILLTVLETSSGWFDFKQLHDALLLEGFTIYPGKIKASRSFRLAVMGDLYPRDIQRFITSLKKYLALAESKRTK